MILIFVFLFWSLWPCKKKVITIGVFVYDFYPFLWIWYLPLVRCAQSWQISHPHSWIKIIYKSTHDITSIYIHRFVSLWPNRKMTVTVELVVIFNCFIIGPLGQLYIMVYGLLTNWYFHYYPVILDIYTCMLKD